MHTACLHHIHEVILSLVFKLCFGGSTGSEIKPFEHFHDSWCKLQTEEWIAIDLDAEIYGKLISAATKFASETLASTNQPCDDYMEFMKLSLSFLVSIPAKDTTFRAPSAPHHARWMAKALYAMKAFMFYHQFHVTDRELRSIRRLATFLALVYMEHWFDSSNSTSAPHNDMILMKKLRKYKEIDSEVVKCAEKAMAGHLWYRSEHLVSSLQF